MKSIQQQPGSLVPVITPSTTVGASVVASSVRASAIASVSLVATSLAAMRGCTAGAGSILRVARIAISLLESGVLRGKSGLWIDCRAWTVARLAHCRAGAAGNLGVVGVVAKSVFIA